ncbi:MAG: hypothetical protein NC408_04310 [Candidatus Gastranaerophilales bacterium]|nr:hypothetical protein [Candidatus Gastranaerophilales bacterium]
MLPKVIYVDTQKKLGKIPEQSFDKNIIKENENTLLSNSISEESEDYEEDEDPALTFAKISVKRLANNPVFANKVKELKERYNL